MIWDRKAKGGFPETKILKQAVRDAIAPDKDLGHSDSKDGGPVAAPEAAAPGASDDDDATVGSVVAAGRRAAAAVLGSLRDDL